MGDKKPGFFQKLFGSSKSHEGGHGNSSGDVASSSAHNKPKRTTSENSATSANSSAHKTSGSTSSAGKTSSQSSRPSSTSDSSRPTSTSSAGGGSSRPKAPRQSVSSSGDGSRRARPSGGLKKSRRRRGNKKNTSEILANVDTSKPLDFPTTPEMILAHHKKKPFLNKNEEWLLVELNEFECLVESVDIIKTIAKHSKFFEVEPDELWEEFFEFVEEMPTYDDIINFDVWQEFRDEKYPC